MHLRFSNMEQLALSITRSSGHVGTWGLRPIQCQLDISQLGFKPRRIR
jgi:hypothetical protein